MSDETPIPVEAYRLAASSDGSWAWAAKGGPAFLATASGDKNPIDDTAGVVSLSFSADGHYLYAGAGRLDMKTRTVDAPVRPQQFGAGLAGERIQQLAATKYTLLAAARSPDGQLLVFSLNHRPGREEGPLPEGMPKMRLLAYDASGNLITQLGGYQHDLFAFGDEWLFATGGDQIDAYKRSDLLKPIERLKPAQTIPSKFGMTSIVLSPDQHWIAYGATYFDPATLTSTGTVTLWDVANAKEGASWRADAEVKDVAFSPDGTRIATAGTEGAKVWRVDGTQLDGGVGEAATAVAFTPDGAELLVALGGAKPRVGRVKAAR